MCIYYYHVKYHIWCVLELNIKQKDIKGHPYYWFENNGLNRHCFKIQRPVVEQLRPADL